MCLHHLGTLSVSLIQIQIHISPRDRYQDQTRTDMGKDVLLGQSQDRRGITSTSTLRRKCHVGYCALKSVIYVVAPHPISSPLSLHTLLPQPPHRINPPPLPTPIPSSDPIPPTKHLPLLKSPSKALHHMHKTPHPPSLSQSRSRSPPTRRRFKTHSLTPCWRKNGYEPKLDLRRSPASKNRIR